MEIIVIIVCLLLSAFFSGMEIAYVSSNKIYLEIEKKQDNFLSNILTKITEKPSKFIATMLVGNNISIVIYGFFMGDLIMNWINFLGYQFSEITNVLIQSIISTLVILITSEFLPKVFFQIYANSLIKFFAVPSYFFFIIFNYISTFIIWISDIILKKFFKTEGDYVPSFFSKIELGNYINEQMSSVDNDEDVDSEIQIFQNALEFSGVKAREIMTPRTELVAVEIHSSVSQLRELFIQTGYSKILIYQNSLDDIIGYVHSFELFKKPRSIKAIMIPVEYVPETIFIKDVLNLLTKKRKSVAVILDEYGGTSGIVTVEDIVEELFGEIEDEHDNDEELIETKIDDKTFLFSARLDVAYINEEYKLEIPESDSYGTLGGFIVDFSKEIPQKGEQITIENLHFVIEEASNNKIDLVKMTITE
ncbi:hemolysin family protein [Flavobacterium aquatile]|uniref:Hemolysin n=1 Tax=Flavobacterium aquatile LMG 4008 = ATCC 11947 TaxID=1453498 RepID=A0A095STD0_9FLAO|nr:hemolysin family protein [Flavobacterium aquatile]KGD67916.1 hemolysin [Flavobacterium aquatile LMG 4008 = ATCC 11947]OXA65409.1 hemolysin [Flavobacterium aquatile] [Flavobacterium aquatile LMG 4008 = ATCC 11947]GEC78969.1 hemolysin [Flavobacterium aquatile]